MAIITLTSDYGNLDHRVPAIKGGILSMNDETKIVDISHEIQAYNLLQTAYILRNSYHHFPKGTAHIITVDSFYRKERRYIIYKIDGHYFLAADNGVLSLIFPNLKPEAVYEITINNRFDDHVHFASRDILVPAAVHLQNGGIPEVIGRKIKNPKQISAPRAVFNESEKMVIGEVIYIDNFGNVSSNISRYFFEKCFANFSKYIVKFRNMGISRIYDQYTDLVIDWENENEYHGKSCAVYNDADLIEITIYKGNQNSGARNLLGLNVGEKIYIEFS